MNPMCGYCPHFLQPSGSWTNISKTFLTVLVTQLVLDSSLLTLWYWAFWMSVSHLSSPSTFIPTRSAGVSPSGPM